MGVALLGSALFGHTFAATSTTPAELKPFILNGTKLLAYAKADLNGDGTSDYVFILEKQKKAGAEDIMEQQRPLYIATWAANGRLKVQKTNSNIVLCSNCGGVFGDPFDSLTAKTKSFSVAHYGGSNYRWAYNYTFNYSRIDKTWQLVAVDTLEYHTSNPDQTTEKHLKPPKDFGKIDIADFNASDFM